MIVPGGAVQKCMKNIWKVMNWKYASELYEKESVWGKKPNPYPLGKFVDTVRVLIINGGECI